MDAVDEKKHTLLIFDPKIKIWIVPEGGKNNFWESGIKPLRNLLYRFSNK